MKGKLICLTVATMVLAACQAARGQGMIVPVRPDVPVRGHWSVKYHHAKITVRDQVATVHVDQAFENHAARDLEVEYFFPIPPGAAIDSLTLLVDGKELPGKLMEAKEARRVYEDIVRRKKDPALLEYMGYGLFRTRAFPLQKGKPASIVVTYTTVCRKDLDVVEVLYPLNTEKYSTKKVEDVKVQVDIKARADITAVYSPSHDLTVKRKGPRRVLATYEAKNELPDTDFQVYYTAADEKIGATVLSHRGDPKQDGYFLVLVSPNPNTAEVAVASKDVVIVLDHSGSMAQHGKIDQAKEALRQVLGSLGTEDRFNVVTFCDSVDTVFGKLTPAGKEKVSEAVDALDRLNPTGGTNIDEALTAAMGMFEADERPGYVLFLTDGLPTVGERNEGQIVKNVEKANGGKVRLFALGVGYDVNARLIDKLVATNRGVSDYVKPKEPLEVKVSRLYDKIKKPVMTDVTVAFEGVRTKMTYPRELPDLFDGGQILLVGRYEDGAATKLTVSGTLAGRKRTFEYKAVLAKASETNRYKFVERLWAVRRVGFLLDEVQLNGETKEVVDELVRLSTEYGIMTPYTSFLADESVALNKAGDIRRLAIRRAEGLARTSTGGAGHVASYNRRVLSEAKRAAAPGGPVPTARPAPGLAMEDAARARGARVYGYSTTKDYEDGKAKDRLESVNVVGGKTLFRRGEVWLSKEAAEKLDLAKGLDNLKDVQVIERFSDAYFKLVRENTIDENRALATQVPNQELIIQLRGKLYRIK